MIKYISLVLCLSACGVENSIGDTIEPEVVTDTVTNTITNTVVETNTITETVTETITVEVPVEDTDVPELDTGSPPDEIEDTDVPVETEPVDTGTPPVVEPEPVDTDGDGFAVEDDCDDDNADVYPNAPEICDDIADNNCDGVLDPLEIDSDQDGYTTCNGDCAENWIWNYPGATEHSCDDNSDNDCDGLIDEADPECVVPEIEDPCPYDGIDQNGDGVDGDIDNQLTYYIDADADGYGDPNATPVAAYCPLDGYVENADDCDDSNVDVNPAAAEICDWIADNNCDGVIDPTDYDGDYDANGDGDFSDPGDIDEYNGPDGYTACFPWQP